MSWTIFWTVAGADQHLRGGNYVDMPTFGQRQVVVATKLAVRHGGGMRGSSMVLALSFRSARGCSSPAK
jgi:hypothetical protein